MSIRFAAVFVGVALLSAPAVAQETPAAPAKASAVAAMSSGTTPIGDILDNPNAKAVVEKYLPGFSSHPQIDMARSFTLKAVQGFQPEVITDEILAKIDADLAALAAAPAS